MKPRSAGKPDIELGKRIRLRRLEQKISQVELPDKLGVSFQQVQKYEKGVNRVGAARLQQLAEALGVSFQQILKYEKGVNRVGVGRLQQIADFLKVDMGYFMGDLSTDSKKTPVVSRFAKFMATKDGADIVEAMMHINSPSLRKGVIQLARTLAGS